MLSRKVKEYIEMFVFALVLMAAGFMAPHEAQAKGPKKEAPAIQVIGKTADQKYNVYKIDGDYEDVKYFANGLAYTSGDLFGKMDYIKKEDVNAHGYKCGFICKDGYQNVVGINPNFAFLAPKK